MVIASFLSLVVGWLARPWTTGDTPWVLDGTNALLDCLSSHDFVACRLSEHLNDEGLLSPIGAWPLLQHVPDLIAVGLGIDSHNDRERILAFLSVTGVVGSVALARLVLSRVRQPAWFWGFLFVVVSGPILVSARSTAGEMLATGLLVCLVAATLLQAPPPLIALAALGASVTKETSYPFMVALGLIGLHLARRRTGTPIRRHVVAGGVGLAVGIGLASLLNVVRFGSVLNTNYLQSQLHTHGVGPTLDYALALLVAPNGGVFVFWPAASTLLATACFLPLLARSGRRNLDMLPALVLVAVLAGLTLGLASWWDPFGSWWGPRFTIPWVLPLVLIGLVAYGEQLGVLVRRLLAPVWRLLLVFACSLILALPQVGYLWRPSTTAPFQAAQDPPCVAPWKSGVASWHACHHDEIWRLTVRGRPLLAYSIEGVATPGGAITGLAVAAALLGCLILLREGLRSVSESK